MNQPAAQSPERLRQHFAQRVVHQTRQVLEIWQRLRRGHWAEEPVQELHDASLRLHRYAERFEQPQHARLALAIGQHLNTLAAHPPPYCPVQIDQLEQLIQRLSRTSLRRGDQLDSAPLPPRRRPLYILLQDHPRAERLVQQLAFFGMAAQAQPTAEAFRAALAERCPSAIILDVDFGGSGGGLQLANELTLDPQQPVPLLFFSLDDTDTSVRLAAVRAGGQAFLTGTLEASTLLEKVELLGSAARADPFRVLIVDDSRAQALNTERVLNGAGVITRTLTEPIRAMDELADFQPDLIILDMYMPACTGAELAKVIRHNDRYVSVPIIFLSAEDDLDKQLDAMSEGGDDFLTKPVQARQLITTVHNRAARARHLQARMIRDSLTGLYNHTHILQLLEDSSTRARRDGQPLSFAMLDIDHFKRVNDQYGHPMGDRVLKSLGLFLRQRLRKTDCIGRYGGEEFAIVMPNTELDAAHKVLDEIRQRFAEILYPAQPNDLRCTFSAGVATLGKGMDALTLGSTADLALYQAKHNGRNCVMKAPG